MSGRATNPPLAPARATGPLAPSLSRGALPLCLALSFASLSCGLYGQLGQKLDVTRAISDGETWIAQSGTVTKVLVLGPSRNGVAAPFSLALMDFRVTAGAGATAQQGDWTRGTPTATFVTRSDYKLLDEIGKPILIRDGATREEVFRSTPVTFDDATPDRIILSGGDPAFTGTYVHYRKALALLGNSTPRDAACAFQVANLGLRATEVRIIGFNSAGMSIYQNPANFAGTLAGSLRVSMSGTLTLDTNITYTGVVELSGTRLDGSQLTHVSKSGNGGLSGIMAFQFEPLDAAGSPLPAMTGTVDYGIAGDSIVISLGDPVSGHYAIALDGGGTARVSPETAPSPTVGECLSLP